MGYKVLGAQGLELKSPKKPEPNTAESYNRNRAPHTEAWGFWILVHGALETCEVKACA